jgi:hypothetical protein
MRLADFAMETIRVKRGSGIRTIIMLLVVVALAVIGVLVWNQWAAGNTQLTILYPKNGAELTGDAVPVQLAASPALQEKLTDVPGQVEIITYLDGKEVARSAALSYNLTGVAPGEHRLEIGLSDQSQANSVSLSVMPTPVSFTLGGGRGAANPLPTASNSLNGVYGNVPAAPDDNVAAPVPTATPAAAQAPTNPPVQVPSSGEGGGSKLAALDQSAVQQVADTTSDPATSSETSQQAAQAQTQAGTGMKISSTQPNRQAVVAAETAAQAQNSDPMGGVFRAIFAFYVAGFIAGLGLIIVLSRHRNKSF